MAEGKESGAIELSIKSNLVCGLTAFVAWDDSEKVPIANHQLIQPCLEDRFLCGFVGRSGPDTDELLLRHSPAAGRTSFLGTTFGEPDLPPEKVLLLLEQRFKRELSNICHRAGVAGWEALVKAIFKWIAEAKGGERLRRHQALQDLMSEIERHAAPILSSATAPNEAQIAEAGAQIRKLLVSFTEKLPKKKWRSWCAR